MLKPLAGLKFTDCMALAFPALGITLTTPRYTPFPLGMKNDGKDSQNKHTDLRPRAVFTNLKFSERLQAGSRSLLFQ